MSDQSAYEREAWELIAHQLGPLLPWTTSEDCTEIMANDDGSVWLDTHSRGVCCLEALTLSGEKRLSIINAVAGAAGKTVTEEHPEIGDILPVLGARFQGIVPPAAPSPLFVIRLPNKRHIPISDYLENDTLTPDQARILGAAIANRQNIVVAGGTGSGKTTFCNALLELMGTTRHRVMLIEDTPELRCPAPNKIHVRVKRQAGFGWRDALHVALRLRPDRIIVGELRDGAATLEMLKAWNTGHNGGLSTIHANSAASTLPRIEQLLEEVVERAPRTLIAQAINVVVYLERYTASDGSSKRRVLDVATVHPEVVGGEYALQHAWHPTAAV